jgi:hypothetical protein
MNDDHRRIIISKISESRRAGSPDNGSIPVVPVNRWVAFLVLIPVVIVMAIVGAFFFAAFLALFAIVAVGFGLRIWWLRRKLRKNMQAEEGDYVIIEDAEIIETEKTKSSKRHH